jgi:prepilin-type N-terminal cleavage/methylation domain-containing protein
MTHRQHTRGFTLVETLLAVSLLAVFSLLAFRLLGANMHITRTTFTSNWNTARFDRAVRMLRADVTGSVSVEMPTPGLLRIHEAGNCTIEWKCTANSLSRSTGTEARTWDLGQHLHLKLDGAVVLLSVNPLDEIAMASLPKGASR